jgi:hypothetical protein
MKDILHYFLGLKVWWSSEKIFLNQGKYAVEIMNKFDTLECKSMYTPMETKLMPCHNWLMLLCTDILLVR